MNEKNYGHNQTRGTTSYSRTANHHLELKRFNSSIKISFSPHLTSRKHKSKPRVHITPHKIPKSIENGDGTIINELKGVKVKDIPTKVKPYLTLTFLKESMAKGIDNYHAKYIVTNSPQPLFHVCYGGMIFSYLVALPEERRHLAHQQHAAAGH